MAISRAWVDLSPPAQEEQHNLSLLREVDAISGTGMDPYLPDTIADTLHVTKIAELHRPMPREDAGADSSVLQSAEPVVEDVRGLQLVHGRSVSARIRIVKVRRG